MDGDQISSLIAPTPTGSVLGGGGRDDTVWWCMRCMTVPRMFLGTYSCSLVYCSLLFPRRPSPRGACSAAQVQQHRIHPRHRHPPRSAAPPKEPWPDVVQVDVPYRRAMGGLHTLIRGQNLAFHTSCSPQSRHAQFSPYTLQGPGEEG